jgi:PAS domain S-box-containing protein
MAYTDRLGWEAAMVRKPPRTGPRRQAADAAKMGLTTSRRPPAAAGPELLQELRVHQIELEMQNDELRRAHHRLEQLHDEYAGLYDFAPVGYLTLAQDGLITKANRTAAAMLGVERDLLPGMKLARFVARADQDAFYKFRHAAGVKGQHQTADFGFVRADGSTFVGHVDGGGTDPAGGTKADWTVVVSDISELARARDKIALLSKAINQNIDAILITDAAGTIAYVNARFTDLTGYTPEEAIGRTPDILRSAETPESVRAQMWRTIRAGGKWRADLEDRRKDGSRFWAHVTLSPILDENGAVSHILMTHEDISERKRLELDLADMAGELARQKEVAELANRTKSEMLANVSHELRTPLNAIIGFSDMMRLEILGPIGLETYKGYSSDILSSGQHLLEIINDILDISAVEAGQVALAVEELTPAVLVDSVLPLVRERAEREGVALEADIPPDLPPLKADRRRLKQILLNLLSNAVKFTPRGGKVEVRAFAGRGAGDGVVFEIADTGVGMDEAGLVKAMLPFGQVDGGVNRRHEGTGLGLPLTKALVELHGGALDLKSALGVGTTATVRLPGSA